MTCMRISVNIIWKIQLVVLFFYGVWVGVFLFGLVWFWVCFIFGVFFLYKNILIKEKKVVGTIVYPWRGILIFWEILAYVYWSTTWFKLFLLQVLIFSMHHALENHMLCFFIHKCEFDRLCCCFASHELFISFNCGSNRKKESGQLLGMAWGYSTILA